MKMGRHGYQLKNEFNQVIEDIMCATQLVENLCLEKIDITTFLHQYDNFYYWLGIDELPISEQAQFLSYSNILSIHKEIQDNAVSRVYEGCFDIVMLHSLGRITADECVAYIKAIYYANELEFNKILKS